MADFFIDRMAKQCLAQWVLAWDKEPDADTHLLNDWRSHTRMMFWKYPAIQVYDLVDECLAQASDDSFSWVHMPEKEIKVQPRVRGRFRNQLDSRLKITDVARNYGLEVKKNKTICPFHADSDPSLSFSDEKNCFNCFGCGAKGDIIEFIRLMEEQRDA